MSIDELAQEEDLAWAFKFIKNSGHPVAIPDSSKITFALLRSPLTLITSPDRSQSIPGLSWDNVLVELYGSEDTLKARVDSLNNQFEDLKPWLEGQKTSVPEAEAIIELAEKYRGGWRPY